jgi:hypothetical protein
MIELIREGKKIVVRDSVRKEINELKASIPQSHHSKIDSIISLKQTLEARNKDRGFENEPRNR